MSDLPEVEQPTVEDRLASRGERFAAAIIDTVIAILATIPFFLYVGLDRLAEPTLTMIATGVVYAIAALIIVHGYLLHHYGQTVGKRFLNIRIENLHGEKATALRIIFLRYLPIQIVTNLPFIGGILALVNIAFIFRHDRRCVHDHIAGTRVCRIPEALRV